MGKVENFQGKQDQMMNENHKKKIYQPFAKPGVPEFQGLMIVSDSEGKTQHQRPQIGDHQTSGSMHPAAILKKVDAQPEQKTVKKHLGLAKVHGQQNDEKNVQIRIYISQKIHVAQDEHLQQHKKNKPETI